MRRRRNGGRPRAGIREAGSGTIRVRKAHSTQYITLTQQIAELLSTFARQPEYEDFTRIKATLQSLNEVVSKMGFTARERRAFRQTVQQVATIPNTNNLPHIWSRIDAALGLIRSYGERIGVEETIVQVITGLQEEVPGTERTGADSEDPVNLINPSLLDRTGADKDPGQGTRVHLSAFVQEVNEQPSRFDDTSRQRAQPRESAGEMLTLLPSSGTEALPEPFDQQLKSGAHAHLVEVAEQEMPALEPETASHALPPAARTSSEVAREDTVQQHPEGLQRRSQHEPGAADGQGRTDAIGMSGPAVPEGRTLPIAPTEPEEGSGEETAGTTETVAPAPQELARASGEAVGRPTGTTGQAGLHKPSGASEAMEAAETAGAISPRVPHGPENERDQADAARIQATGPPGPGLSEPVIGGTLLYTGESGTQLVKPQSPVIFTASSVQGVSFNGTDALTITSAGFYYLEWRISLPSGQSVPSAFGIVQDGNTSGTAGLHTSQGKALVSGSAVLNCSVGNTLALYNHSQASVSIKASQLSISKIRN